MLRIQDSFDAFEAFDELRFDVKHADAVVQIADQLGLEHEWDSEGDMRYLNVNCPLDQAEALLAAIEQSKEASPAGVCIYYSTPAERDWLKACRWADALTIEEDDDFEEAVL